MVCAPPSTPFTMRAAVATALVACSPLVLFLLLTMAWNDVQGLRVSESSTDALVALFFCALKVHRITSLVADLRTCGVVCSQGIDSVSRLCALVHHAGEALLLLLLLWLCSDTAVPYVAECGPAAVM